jgi:PAS domain S-box-containing protein
MGMFYLMFLPFLAVTASLAMRYRYRHLDAMEAASITTHHAATMKARCAIRNYYKLLRSRGDVWIDKVGEIADAAEQAHHHIAAAMEFGCARFASDPEMRLFAATFYTTILFNRTLSYREINCAEKLKPDYEFRHRLYRLKVQLNEASRAVQSKEVADYLEFNYRRAELDNNAMEAMRCLVQFWTELMQPRPDIDDLSSLGERARYHLTATTAHLERLLVLNPQCVPILRLSAIIHLEIMGDLQEAISCFEQADKIEAERRDSTLTCNYGSFLRPIDVSIDIFDESNGILNISTNEDSFALVEHANEAVLAMFGYSASAVIGQNVSKLIAEPIASHHDAYIRNYLTQKQGSMVVNSTRMVLGRHANGHLLPLALYVRWADESLGKMIAVMKPLFAPQEICCIVDPDTDRITATTANLHTICGFSRRDIASSKLGLADLLPPLRDEDHDAAEAALVQVQGARGLHCDSEHVVTRQRFHLHAFVSTIPVLGGHSFRFVRLVVSQIAQEEDALFSDAELMSDIEDAAAEVVGVAPGAAPAAAVTHMNMMDALDSAEALAKAARKKNRIGITVTGASTITNTVVDVSAPASASAFDPLSPYSTSQSFPLPTLRATMSAPVSRMNTPSMSPREERQERLERLVVPVRTPAQTFDISNDHTGGSIGDSASASVGNSFDQLLNANASSSSLPALESAFTDNVPSASFFKVIDTTTDAIDNASPVPYLTIPTSEVATTDPTSIPATHTTADPAIAPANAPTRVATPLTAKKADVARSQARRKRSKNNQARLRRAIAIDETNTNKQLRLMNLTSVLMIVIVLTMILVMNFLAIDYLQQSADISNNIYLSSIRQVLLIDTIAILRIDSALRGTPNPLLTGIFYSPGAHASSAVTDVVAGIRNRLVNSLDAFSSVSLEMDLVKSSNKDLLRIRNDDVIDVSLVDIHGVPTAQKYPLRYASLSFSALARLSFTVPPGEIDPGYYYCMYSGIDTIRSAMRDTTTFMTDDLSALHQELLVIMLAILAASLVGVIAVAMLFARPLIVRVETAKTRVLNILLHVPHAFRRNLRRKAMLVFKLVKKDVKGNTDTDMDEIAHKDEQEAASASEAVETDVEAGTSRGSGVGVSAGSEFTATASMYSQNSQGFSDAMRRYQQQRLGGAGTSLAKMSALANAQALATRSVTSDGSDSAAASSFTELDAESYRIINQSLLSRRSVRVIIAKYLGFISTIAVFFALCYWQMLERSADVEESIGYYTTRQYTFFDYEDMLANTPYDPLLTLGDFRTAAFKFSERSREYNRIVLTGDPVTGKRLPLSSRLDSLHYDSVCDISPEEFRKYVPDAPDYLFEFCPTVNDGVFTKGLANALIYCYDQFPNMLQPDAETTLNRYVESLPPPPGVSVERMQELVDLMYDVDYLINYFMKYYLMYSAAISIDDIKNSIGFTRIIILVFVSVFSVFLLGFYLAMFQPMTTAIAKTSNQAKSLMLILPPEIMRHVKAAQQYVDEQISNE